MKLPASTFCSLPASTLVNEYCYLFSISTVGPKTGSFNKLELVYMMMQKVILCFITLYFSD